MWYADGLRFSCHQCGNCCRGAQPGWVYVTPFRLRRIAGFLGQFLGILEVLPRLARIERLQTVGIDGDDQLLDLRPFDAHFARSAAVERLAHHDVRFIFAHQMPHDRLGRAALQHDNRLAHRWVEPKRDSCH